MDVENYGGRGQRVMPLHRSDAWHKTHAGGDFNWASLTKGWRRNPGCQCRDGFLGPCSDRTRPRADVGDGISNRWPGESRHLRWTRRILKSPVGEGSPAADGILTSFPNVLKLQLTPRTPVRHHCDGEEALTRAGRASFWIRFWSHFFKTRNNKKRRQEWMEEAKRYERRGDPRRRWGRIRQVKKTQMV